MMNQEELIPELKEVFKEVLEKAYRIFGKPGIVWTYQKRFYIGWRVRKILIAGFYEKPSSVKRMEEFLKDGYKVYVYIHNSVDMINGILFIRGNIEGIILLLKKIIMPEPLDDYIEKILPADKTYYVDWHVKISKEIQEKTITALIKIAKKLKSKNDI